MNDSKITIWLPTAVSACMLLIVYLFKLNQSLFYAINSSSLYLGSLWVHLTLFGDGLIAALLMIPLLRKHHRIVWAMLWTAIVFNIVLHGLKAGLDLPRPPHVLPTDTFFIIGPEYHHRSFPSGHTTTAFAVAGVLALGIKNRWLQTGLFVAALLVGLSRIGVGVHWPTDVLAGVIIGWGSAWLGWHISGKIPIGNGFIFQLILGALLLISALVWLMYYNTHYPQTDWLRYTLGLILLVWGVIDYARIIAAHRISKQT